MLIQFHELRDEGLVRMRETNGQGAAYLDGEAPKICQMAHNLRTIRLLWKGSPVEHIDAFSDQCGISQI